MKLTIDFKDGRKQTFNSIESFNVTEEQAVNNECDKFEVSRIPTEGKLFEVNLLSINRNYFKQMTRETSKIQRVNRIILEAFAEVDKNPGKYASSFYTIIPEKKWNDLKNPTQLKKYANDFGGWMADWVVQALEWAQRISNGESWKTICEKRDNANNYRMIVWKDGDTCFVGGSSNHILICTATDLNDRDIFGGSDRMLYRTVPLVVIQKK